MEVIRLAPGEPCPPADTGDVLLIRGTATISKLIMLVQPYSHVVPLLDSENGADAQAYGCVERPVSVYDDTPRVLVRVDASADDRDQISAFLESVLAARWKYGYLQFAAVTLAMLTGWKLTFGVAGTSICSALAASALTRAGFIFDTEPAYVTPKALAEKLGVL